MFRVAFFWNHPAARHGRSAIVIGSTTPGSKRLVEHVLRGGVKGGPVHLGERPAKRRASATACGGKLIERVLPSERPAEFRVPRRHHRYGVRRVGRLSEVGRRWREPPPSSLFDPVLLFHAGQTELTSLCPELGRAICRCRSCLYNMPSLTKVWFEIEDARAVHRHRANRRHQGTAAATWPTSNVLQSLRELRPDWSLMIGPEHLLADSVRLRRRRRRGRRCETCCRDCSSIATKRPRPATQRDCVDVPGRDRQLAKDLRDRQVRLATHQGNEMLPVVTWGICDDFMAEPFQKVPAA